MDTESRNAAAGKHQELAGRYRKGCIACLCLCGMTLCGATVTIKSFSAIWWIIAAFLFNVVANHLNLVWAKHAGAVEALRQ